MSTFSGVLASQGWKKKVSWQKQTAVLTVPRQRTVWKVSRKKQEREKGCQAGVGSWLVKRGGESWGEVGEEGAEELADKLGTR